MTKFTYQGCNCDCHDDNYTYPKDPCMNCGFDHIDHIEVKKA